MTYAETAAHGLTLKIGDGASPEQFTEIKGIKAGPDGPGISPNFIETFHHDSADVKKYQTTIAYEPVTCTLDWDSADTQHAALLAASQAGTLKNFQATYVDTGAMAMAFAAWVGLKFTANPDGWNEAAVTLTLKEAPTIT